MAVTRPIRWNLQVGTLGVSMAASDTSINFGAVPAFPTLNNAASGDYVPITLINATALSNSEIMYLTGYTAGNSTGAVLRSQETSLGGGSTVSWSSAAIWEHSPTAFDVAGPQGVTLSGNTAGTLAGITAGSMTIAGGDNVTVSQASGNAFSINAYPTPMSFYPYTPISTVGAAMPGQGATAATNTTISAYIWPMAVQNPVDFNNLRLPVVMSATTTVTSQNFSYTEGFTFGVYTLNGTNLSLVSSWSNVQRFSQASTNTSGSGSATWQMSFGGSNTDGTGSASLSTASNTALTFWTVVTGSKLLPFMSGSTTYRLPAGQYFGVAARTLSTAGSSLYAGVVQAARQTHVALTYFQDIGNTATANTTAVLPLMGSLSTILRSDTTWPNTIASSQVSTTGGNVSLASFVFLFNRVVT